jgi:hypothetical protein
MKKTSLVIFTLIFSLGIISCESRRDNIRLATGGSTGTYFAFGTIVAGILQESTGITINVHSTGASRANIHLINSGDAEIAIAQNDVMDYAWRGVDLFNGERISTFNTMAALYAEVCQIVVRADSGIRTIADLRGKIVSVGDAGSGVEFNARQILEVYGLSFDDINKQNMGFGTSAESLRDNRIDAFFCVAGAPTPAVIDLAANRDIMILEIDDAHAEQLMRNYPFYTIFPIPAGSYRGQDAPVQTVAVKATLIVSTRMNEETVYTLTRSLFENRAAIEAAHTKGSEISPAYAVEGISVPFHPGAARYFREVGVLH